MCLRKSSRFFKCKILARFLVLCPKFVKMHTLNISRFVKVHWEAGDVNKQVQLYEFLSNLLTLDFDFFQHEIVFILKHHSG